MENKYPTSNIKYLQHLNPGFAASGAKISHTSRKKKKKRFGRRENIEGLRVIREHEMHESLRRGGRTSICRPQKWSHEHPWEWYIYLHENHKNVGKYTCPMDGMRYIPFKIERMVTECWAIPKKTNSFQLYDYFAAILHLN